MRRSGGATENWRSDGRSEPAPAYFVHRQVRTRVVSDYKGDQVMVVLNGVHTLFIFFHARKSRLLF